MAATSTTVMIDRSSLQKTLSHDINISKTAIDIIFLFIISSAFCIAGTKRQSVDVLESKDRTRALVKYESYSIVTSPNYRYIGKIKNYIFFYNKKLKRADVYPLADAKKILVISSNE